MTFIGFIGMIISGFVSLSVAEIWYLLKKAVHVPSIHDEVYQSYNIACKLFYKDKEQRKQNQDSSDHHHANLKNYIENGIDLSPDTEDNRFLRFWLDILLGSEVTATYVANQRLRSLIPKIDVILDNQKELLDGNKNFVKGQDDLKKASTELKRATSKILEGQKRDRELIQNFKDDTSKEQVEQTRSLHKVNDTTEEINKKLDAHSSEDGKRYDKMHNKLSELADKVDAVKYSLTAQNVFTPPSYSPVPNHIPRQVVVEKDKNSFLRLSIDPQKDLLIEKIEELTAEGENQQLAFILYSDAQTGKSTELKNLTYQFQVKGYCSYFFNLTSCKENDSLEEKLHIIDLKLTDKKIVLLLDSLDEKPIVQRLDTLKDIQYIKDTYPEILIIVSCRTNFQSEIALTGFMELYLNPLSSNDILTYITSHLGSPGKAESLINRIRENNLYPLLNNPFYLIGLLDYYEKKGQELPDNFASLYEFFIDRTFNVDNSREIFRRDPITALKKGKRYLQRMAYAMQRTRKYELRADELPDDFSDFLLLNQFGILQRSEEDVYFFEHMSFKEFLVAQILSTLSFDKIMELVSIASINKIRTEWHHIFVLLMGIIDPLSDLFKELSTWMLENEKEISFELDRTHFDKETRITLFKEIFTSYASENLLLPQPIRRKMMAFSNTQESINFLITELQNVGGNAVKKQNALVLLPYIDYNVFSADTKRLSEIETVIFSLYHAIDTEENYPILSLAIFKNIYFTNPQRMDRVVNLLKKCSQEIVIDTFVQLLADTGYFERYLDLFLTGTFNFIDQRQYPPSCYTRNPQTYLKKYGKLIIKKENILKVLRHFKDNSQEVLRGSSQVLGILNDYLDKSKSFLSDNIYMDELKDVVLELADLTPVITQDPFRLCYRNYLLLMNPNDVLYKESLDRYLMAESSAIKDILKEKKILCLLMDEEKFNQLLNENTDLSEESYNTLFLLLPNYNYALRFRLEETLLTKFGKLKEERRTNEWDILLDKEFFSQEATSLLDLIEKTPGKNINEIWNVEPTYQYIDVVFRFVDNYSVRAVSILNNELEFNWFVLDSLYQKLKEGFISDKINEEQRSKLIPLIQKMSKEKLDMDKGQTILFLAVLCDVDLDTVFLLESLPNIFLSDFQNRTPRTALSIRNTFDPKKELNRYILNPLFIYIERKVTKDILKNHLLHLVRENKITAQNEWCFLMAYVFNNKEETYYTEFIQSCFHPGRFATSLNVQEKLLHFLLQLTNHESILDPLFDTMIFSNQILYLDSLPKEKRKYKAEKLLKLHRENENNIQHVTGKFDKTLYERKGKLAMHLCQINEIEGLLSLKDLLLTPIEYYPYAEFFCFDKLETLPHLFEILDLLLKEANWRIMSISIVNSINSIAMTSEELLTDVIEKYQSIFKMHPDNREFYYYAQDLPKEFYEKRVPSVSITEAFKEV